MTMNSPAPIPPLTDDMLRYAMAAMGTGSPEDAAKFRLFWRFAKEAANNPLTPYPPAGGGASDLLRNTLRAWAEPSRSMKDRECADAALEAALRDVQQLERDAGRYRWLRANCNNRTFDRHETVQLVIRHIEFDGLAETFGVEGAADRYVDQAMREHP